MRANRESLSSQQGERSSRAGKSGHSLEASERQTSSDLALFTIGGDIRRLHDIHKEILMVAMRHYGGRTTQVARALGIGRSTLYRNLADFQIQWNEISDWAKTDHQE